MERPDEYYKWKEACFAFYEAELKFGEESPEAEEDFNREQEAFDALVRTGWTL